MKDEIIKIEKNKKGKIITTILLNRILLPTKSPVRKTHKQLAKRLSCDVKVVERAETFICHKLSAKVAVLEILVNIN